MIRPRSGSHAASGRERAGSQSGGALAEVAGLGWMLLTGVIAGVVGGTLLDRWFSTKPIFTISLTLAGIGLGIFGVARAASRSGKSA